jgi:hypothetical protein
LRRHRRLRGSRGATIVEAAIVTPVLMLFVFGVFEFGFAFRDYLAVANSTRDGVREASVSGNVTDADFRMIKAMDKAAAALPNSSIERIVVFRASGPDDVIPDACKTTTSAATLVANSCNYYEPGDFALDLTEYGCDPAPNPVPDPDRHWCPADRIVSVGAGLDYVGVYMRVEHDYITGLFGDSITFEDTSILKVEPQEV